MQIFKFGGASVRNPKTIGRLKEIVEDNAGELIVVVSAMGKTTTYLEQLLIEYLKAWYDIDEVVNSFSDINKLVSPKKENWIKNKKKTLELYKQIVDYHREITDVLLKKEESRAFVELFFEQLRLVLEIEPSMNYDYEYDRIIPFGELISTRIISLYLSEQDVENKWMDIRKNLKTGEFFRDARVDWKLTEKLTKQRFNFEDTRLYITQGFIGSTANNQTTTLGREGSDFTASILAFVLNAENVTVWKDVEGVYNADPKYFKEVELLEKISYHEAIEQTYYGAKVIHPKTIKPLQNKKIPMYVKSFENPSGTGTLIHSYEKWNRGVITKDVVPVFIQKNNQALIKIIPFDYSFIAEDNLSTIFALFAKHRVSINLMQNSAISFMACFDNDSIKVMPLVEELKNIFQCDFSEGYQLLTVRHYNDGLVNEMIGGRNIIIEERNRVTARYLLK